MNISKPAKIRETSSSHQSFTAWFFGIVVVICSIGAGFWLLAYRPACTISNNTEAPLHILFIGNSYTYMNDLPGVFSQLACSGGHKVETETVAVGGWTLADHIASPKTGDKLKQRQWDFVILQEQSQLPASESARIQSMYPAVRELASQIEARGARPVLLMTWGHRDGWPEAGYPTYEDMQAQLTEGYLGISNELQIPVAPVGEAWRQARAQSPPLDLWQADGSHPNLQGTYLAASVLYAVIFRQSPEGLTYGKGLSLEAMRNLQSLAASTVLTEPERWNLH
jgi:hypothetical protein